MSGYSDFTSWISGGADYLIYKGSKVKIKNTFFTSVPGPHNSDEFNIKLENGKVVGLDDNVDLNDLHERYDNSTPERKKAAEKALSEAKEARLVRARMNRMDESFDEVKDRVLERVNVFHLLKYFIVGPTPPSKIYVQPEWVRHLHRDVHSRMYKTDIEKLAYSDEVLLIMPDVKKQMEKTGKTLKELREIWEEKRLGKIGLIVRSSDKDQRKNFPEIKKIFSEAVRSCVSKKPIPGSLKRLIGVKTDSEGLTIICLKEIAAEKVPSEEEVEELASFLIKLSYGVLAKVYAKLAE